MKNLLIPFSLIVLLSSACMKNSQLERLDQSSITRPPDTTTIRIENYQPKAGFEYQNIFVSNFSVQASKGQISQSTARDGLTDALKIGTFATYGFSTTSPESVVDGFSDLFLFKTGLSMSQYSQIYCPVSQYASTANDMFEYPDHRYPGSPLTSLGLRDCQKSYLGLDPASFDNNQNGIPDYYELRCGLNPLNRYEAFTSTSGDDMLNIDKCKKNIPIDEDIRIEPNELLAYRYSYDAFGDGSGDFEISNIPVIDQGEENFIAIYITEINPVTKEPRLTTAYTILKRGYHQKILQIEYWGTEPDAQYNQEIPAP